MLAYLRTVVVNGSRSRRRRLLMAWRVRLEPLAPVPSAEAADGAALAFLAYQCRGGGQEIGFIRGQTIKAWPTAGFAGFLSLSADGSMLGYTESGFGYGGTAQVLDTRSEPGSATVATRSCTPTPLGGREPVVTLGADGTTMYVSWITGWDTLHLAGFRMAPPACRVRCSAGPSPAGCQCRGPAASCSSGTQGSPSTWSIP